MFVRSLSVLFLLHSFLFAGYAFSDSFIWGDSESADVPPVLYREVEGRLSLEALDAAVLEPSLAGTQRWVTLLCKFADVDSEPITAAFAQHQYDAPGGLNAYWVELSANAINLQGSTAAGWFLLPQARSAYIDPSIDLMALAQDCTSAAEPSVDFSLFDHIALLFNDDLDNRAYGGAITITLEGVRRTWGMIWTPPWAYINLTYMEHEMGHAYGLPHSSGQYGNTYDNQWDVMSYAGLCDVRHPEFGCLGQHTIAYHKEKLGWIPDYQTITVPAGSTQLINLDYSDLQQSTIRSIHLPEGSDTYYTLEARRRVGFDAKLPGDAVIIHAIDTARAIPAHVFDSDNNYFNGDAGTMWGVGESFADLEKGIAITVLSRTAAGFTILAANQPLNVTAFIDADRVEGKAPLAVNFHGIALGGNPPYSFEWDFGNGSFSSAQDPAVVFVAEGDFSVRLVVTDATGAKSGFDMVVHMSAPDLFSDNFEDGDSTGWDIKGKSWSVDAGALHMNRKGAATALFAGCGECTVEAELATENGSSKITLFAGYRSKSSRVELTVRKGKWKFRQKDNGRVVASAKASAAVPENTPFTIRISYSAGMFTVWMNEFVVLQVSTSVPPFGTAGIAFKPTKGSTATASLRSISIF